jgi:hypothetical protein
MGEAEAADKNRCKSRARYHGGLFSVSIFTAMAAMATIFGYFQ